MQWPNQDIQPPRKPHGSRIDRRIQRYPPPVSGNAEPSSMYAIAVNIVTTKFSPKARISDGPVIAKPGPTRRKIVVPIVGPRPIIVISRRPRSRRNLTSTSRACAIRSAQTGASLLALGRGTEGFQIHRLADHAVGASPGSADEHASSHQSEQSRIAVPPRTR